MYVVRFAITACASASNHPVRIQQSLLCVHKLRVRGSKAQLQLTCLWKFTRIEIVTGAARRTKSLLSAPQLERSVSEFVLPAPAATVFWGQNACCTASVFWHICGVLRTAEHPEYLVCCPQMACSFAPIPNQVEPISAFSHCMNN